jgi:hypothetical protein
MPAIPPKFPLPPAPAAAQPETAPQTQELAPEDFYYEAHTWSSPPRIT